MRYWILSTVSLIFIGILVTCFCPGCGTDDPNRSSVEKSEPNVVVEKTESNIAVTEPETEGVAAIVNGINILQSEVDDLIRPNLEQLAEKTKNAPAGTADSYVEQFRQLALEQLIRRALLDAEIQKAKVVITDDQVRRQIEEMASSQNVTVAAFNDAIRRQGRSVEDVRKEIRAGLARNQFMTSQWEGKINVTEQDAMKYYEDNKEEFIVPETIRTSHILVTPEVIGDPNSMANARTKIVGLLAELKNGADFAELAKAHSNCPSAPEGGDLDFMPRGKATPAFDKVAFSLKVGQISDVVETNYGFHIIKVTDRRDASDISFDQVKEQLILRLTEQQQLEFANKYLEKLKADAEIVYPSNS